MYRVEQGVLENAPNTPLAALETDVEVVDKLAPSKILLVDDDEAIRISLKAVLERSGFEVVAAGSVHEALALIQTQNFDVLLSDLHMPDAGDGLTVVSAMRHCHPKAVTLIFSGFPNMKEAAAAILMQADEILAKPMAVAELVATVKERLKLGATPGLRVDTVANVLEQETQLTIDSWLLRVHSEIRVITVQLDDKARSAHLPHLFRDLVFRLRNPLPLGTRALVSPAAAKHGIVRRTQGYTAAMLVEESRMLQVSIFETLQSNLHKIDFSLLLVGVMAIADEVDSQLAQTMASFILESEVLGVPA